MKKLTPQLRKALFGRLNHHMQGIGFISWDDLCDFCNYQIGVMHKRQPSATIMRLMAAVCQIQGFILLHDISAPSSVPRSPVMYDGDRFAMMDEMAEDLARLVPAINDFTDGFHSESDLLDIIGTTKAEWQRMGVDYPNELASAPVSRSRLKYLA